MRWAAWASVAAFVSGAAGYSAVRNFLAGNTAFAAFDVVICIVEACCCAISIIKSGSAS
ncbi:hypothetical protein [Azospirillum sp. TSO5]|uniref:hypothetical protein n=1 Tax=Azospirillum sp. TSO5 TaxID=716760 RepID=UPI001304DF7E|nr:hypothetical protein [Azospirillum sp. TSO5]